MPWLLFGSDWDEQDQDFKAGVSNCSFPWGQIRSRKFVASQFNIPNTDAHVDTLSRNKNNKNISRKQDLCFASGCCINMQWLLYCYRDAH